MIATRFFFLIKIAALLLLPPIACGAGPADGNSQPNIERPQRSARAAKFCVAVDAGHSRASFGALSARNRPEYDFNRKMALLLLRLLEKNPRIKAFLVNADGDGITLQQRTALLDAKKPDLIISIHHDSVRADQLSDWTWRGRPAQYCDRFLGYSIMVSQRNAKAKASRSFGLILGARMRKAGFLPATHHLEPANGTPRTPVDVEKGVYLYDNLFVLKDTHSPAVMLECGIIRNRSEETLLRNRAYILRMARTLSAAVEQFADSRRK